jgi:hypothetical protein
MLSRIKRECLAGIKQLIEPEIGAYAENAC